MDTSSGLVNSVSQKFPHIPDLIALKENITNAFDQTPPPEGYDFENCDIFNVVKNPNAIIGNGIYKLNFNATVDIILQNTDCLLMKVRRILGVYMGMIFGRWAMEKANLISIMIQTSVFCGSDYGSSLVRFGWTVLLFQADNPGSWAFRCHIEAHFYLGMGVVFAEGIERIGPLPSSIMGCMSRN